MSVRMSHPEVDEEITVAESAVPFHASAGWAVVDDVPKGEQADGGEQSDGEKTKGGRASASAAKKKEQD